MAPKSNKTTKSKPKKTRASSSAKMTKEEVYQRRVYWGIALIAFAVLVILAFFCEGWFIDWLGIGLRSLMGVGFYIFPVACILAAVRLFVEKKRHIYGKLILCFVVPFVFGALVSTFSKYQYTTVGDLFVSGNALSSGGFISGGFACLLSGAISPIGAKIFVVLGLIVSLIAAFGISWSTIVGLFTGLHREVEEWEDEPEPQVAEEPAPVKEEASVKARPQIDIPLDEPKPKKEEKNGLFGRGKSFGLGKSKVKSPAEAASNEAKPDSAEEGEIDESPAPIEVPISDLPPWEPEPCVATVIGGPRTETTHSVSVADQPQEMPDAHEKKNDEVVVPLDINVEAPAEEYVFPPLDLLTEAPVSAPRGNNEELRTNGIRLVETLRSFGIETKIVDVTRGPSVTRYEIQIDKGIKFSRITSLADDIALSLGASGVRISPLPDKLAIGIEVPNKVVSVVYLREVLESAEFQNAKSNLSFSLGRDIGANCIVGNIGKLPHLLIAGTTGSGKSVCINSLIISLLYKASPDDVRLIMIDPKMVELGVYNGIPHLLVPVVTDPKKAAGALNWSVNEMERRYQLFSEAGTRDLESYNAYAAEHGADHLPKIVVIIDELADLMLVAKKEVETAICRLAAKARAAGMHLIVATQRPSADVITGLMKANIPSRIAFAVASHIESQIILDGIGAEKLVGRGDMLYAPIGSTKPTRIQGCFITDNEVAQVCEFLKQSFTPSYSEEITQSIEKDAANVGEKPRAGGVSSDEDPDEDSDELFNDAVDVVMETGQASSSMLQRRLKIGYSRAARIIDQMEDRGILGAFEGSKPRKILITRDEWEEIKERQLI